MVLKTTPFVFSHITLYHIILSTFFYLFNRGITMLTNCCRFKCKFPFVTLFIASTKSDLQFLVSCSLTQYE